MRAPGAGKVGDRKRERSIEKTREDVCVVDVLL
jgi:hypothetical protein